jgi:hypothetical protein
MNEIDVIERQIASLTDRLDRASVRIAEINQQKQALAYDLHVGEDKTAKTRFKNLADELLSFGVEQETLVGALAELRRRKALALGTLDRADAAAHRARARTILAELIECAPLLDVQRPHPDDAQPYSPNNPPLCIRTATLTAALLVELKALNLYHGTPFPPWHGASSIIDLEKALRNLACLGWPSLAGLMRPATTKSIAFGVRPTVDFTRLLEVWGQAVDADLARHEQTTEQSHVAA